MPAAGRNAMADDVITIMKDSSLTNLDALDDNAIQYGLRTFEQMFSVQYQKGMFIGVARGPLTVLTMGAAKQSLDQVLQFQIFVVGHDPEVDQRLCVDLAEDAEQELYDSTNLTLTNGGEFQGDTEFIPGPPLGRGREELTLHWVLMEVLYQKTTSV